MRSVREADFEALVAAVARNASVGATGGSMAIEDSTCAVL